MSSLPPLSISILGVEPLDEFIKEIADFIHHMILTRPADKLGTVEVEAKLGLLKDRAGQRIKLPVHVETILTHEVECRFESNMTPNQHKHFNTMLNDLNNRSHSTGTPIDYSHKYLVDTFYPASENPHNKDKIRVTRDEKSGNVIECMKKIRLGDLNISSPKRAADWRVSVNLEVPVPPPVGTSTHTRRKDRISYSHEECRIDLTQVTASANGLGGPSEVLHELEIEIARPSFLLAAAAKRGDPNATEAERNAFDELIRVFVNNARILTRNSIDSWH